MLILSGARQGERVELDSDTFRVGDSKKDDFRFESSADPGARGRRIEFSKTEDGWKIRNLGSAPVTVNQKTVANSMQVRSGDIIRMSDTGPDFSFDIVSGKKKTAANSAAPEVRNKQGSPAGREPVADEQRSRETVNNGQARGTRMAAIAAVGLIACFAAWYFGGRWGESGEPSRLKLPTFPEQIVNEGQRLSLSLAIRDSKSQDDMRYTLVGEPPEGAKVNETTGVFSWTPDEQQGPGDYTFTVKAVTSSAADSLSGETSFSVHVNETNQPPSIRKPSLRSSEVEVGQEFRYTFSATDADHPSQQLRYQLLSETSAGVKIDERSGSITWRPTDEQAGQTHVIHVRVTDNGQPALYDDATLQVTVEAFDPWKRVVQKIAPAVYLLAVEEGKSHERFPYGTAVAIGPKTLLTSAALATELERRRRAGWTVVGLQDFGQVQIPIQDIKVHQGFIGLSDTPADQIYFDLAILSTTKTLPDVCQFAAAETVAKLERGQPLLCLGYPHEGTALTRFDFPRLTEFSGNATALSTLSTDDTGGSGSAPTLLHVALSRGDSTFAELPPINL